MVSGGRVDKGAVRPHPAVMDTLKILLGATVALLLGALAVFLVGGGERPDDELAVLRKQLDELKLETQRLKLEKERLGLQEVTTRTAPSAFVTEAEASAKVRELEEKMDMLAMDAEAAKADAARAEEEASLLTERYSEDRNKLARRARLINDAMEVAAIAEWVDDPNFGAFATLKVHSPENVQSGTVLAIRRNGGVLGRLKVAEVTIDGALANPVGVFGEVKPQVGDELILDEVVKLAD